MDKPDIEQILKRYRTVAVVGLSKDQSKASHQVAKYLQRQGYKIVPVNPTADEILGQKVYKNLLDMPAEMQKTIEIVDIFRPSEDILPIVNQAIQLKKKYGQPSAVWMQLGITNQEAAEKAQKAELTVVMDKCIMKEHGRLFGEKDPELEKIRNKKIQKMKTESENPSDPITVTDAIFAETVIKYPLIVIDCWAAWCGPCRMIAPIIEELAREYAGKIVFAKLNVDENPDTAMKFGVMGIPTLLIMKSGKEVDRIVGVVPKAHLESKLKQYM